MARQDGDLLVISAGHQSPLQKLAGCGVSRYCLAHADCPVLAIPPPPLAQEACYGLRGSACRHRWIRAAAQPALAPIHHVNGPPEAAKLALADQPDLYRRRSTRARPLSRA